MSKTIIFLFALLMISPAWGQNQTALEGKREFSLHGNLDYQAPNGDNIDLRLGYGWFLRDDWLLGLNFQWVLIEDIAPGEDDYRAQQAGVEMQYLFRGSEPWLPYAGVEAGLRNLKFENASDSGLVLGVSSGARYLLNDSVAIDFTLRFLTSSEALFIVDFEAEKRYLVPAIGIHAIF